MSRDVNEPILDVSRDEIEPILDERACDTYCGRIRSIGRQAEANNSH